MSRLIALFTLSVITLSLFSLVTGSLPKLAPLAPLHGRPEPTLPNQYIVALKKGSLPADVQTVLNSIPAGSLRLKHKYDVVFPGFSGIFPTEILDFIRRHPLVDYVEHDSLFHIATLYTVRNDPLQQGELWGLDVLDKVLYFFYFSLSSSLFLRFRRLTNRECSPTLLLPFSASI